MSGEPAAIVAGCTRDLADAGLRASERAALLLYRSRAHEALGEQSSALVDLDEAIGLDPRNIEARRARAEHLSAQGHDADALADFDAVAAAAPEDGKVLLERGIARWRSLTQRTASSGSANQTGFAMLQNQLCVEVQSDCPGAASALADIGRAIDLLTGPERATALSWRASILMARNDLQAALVDDEAALLLRPDEPSYLGQRAGIRAALGDNAGALADLDRSLTVRPGDPGTLIRRAELRARTGDLEGARTDVGDALSKPVDGDPDWHVKAIALRRSLARPGGLGRSPELSHLVVETVGQRLSRSGEEVISIELGRDSTKRFAALSTAYVGARSQLIIDGTVVAEPRIFSPILDGKVDLSGAFSHAEAVSLAARLGRPSAVIGIKVTE